MISLVPQLLLLGTVFAGAPVPDPRHALLAAPDQYLGRPDARLRYRDLGGSGEVVVMLHGYSDDLTVWTRVADSLAGTFRVIALDQRGFGKSTIHPGAPFGKAMSDDVIALLDHLGIAQVDCNRRICRRFMAIRLDGADDEAEALQSVLLRERKTPATGRVLLGCVAKRCLDGSLQFPVFTRAGRPQAPPVDEEAVSLRQDPICDR